MACLGPIIVKIFCFIDYHIFTKLKKKKDRMEFYKVLVCVVKKRSNICEMLSIRNQMALKMDQATLVHPRS